MCPNSTLEVQQHLPLADAAVVGEEVDGGRLLFEGVEDRIYVLLLVFRPQHTSTRPVFGENRGAVRARPVAQEELEGRDVLVQQRHLGRSPALLVLEVDRRICVEQKTYDFNLTLLSSEVEGGVSVDILHVESGAVVDEEARHRSMSLHRGAVQRGPAILVHDVWVGPELEEEPRAVEQVVHSSHHQHRHSVLPHPDIHGRPRDEEQPRDDQVPRLSASISALSPSFIPCTPLGRVALSDPSGSWPIPSRRRTRASSSFPTATSSSFASFWSCFASFTRAFSVAIV